MVTLWRFQYISSPPLVRNVLRYYFLPWWESLYQDIPSPPLLKCFAWVSALFDEETCLKSNPPHPCYGLFCIFTCFNILLGEKILSFTCWVWLILWTKMTFIRQLFLSFEINTSCRCLVYFPVINNYLDFVCLFYADFSSSWFSVLFAVVYCKLCKGLFQLDLVFCFGLKVWNCKRFSTACFYSLLFSDRILDFFGGKIIGY